MKAIGLAEFGGPEVLTVVDVPDPEPGPREVRIRVHAAGVNPTDITFRSGGRAAQLAEHAAPYVPGVDAAGVVDKLGTGSDGRLTVGDPVSAFVVPMSPRGGSYAEYIVVPEASVVPAPRGASIWEAATLLLNATTARLSLNALALSCGQTVAIVGGSGAVGGYAIQLAKAEDGLTVLTHAIASDEELVRSLGADLIVDTTSDIADEIRRELPDGVLGVIDGAALNEAILPAIADGGGLATLKGWNVRLSGTSPSIASPHSMLRPTPVYLTTCASWPRMELLPCGLLRSCRRHKLARPIGGWPLVACEDDWSWTFPSRCDCLGRAGGPGGEH
jgi:NADPH:quinone reductase-like Zn-dependent oxidoreductase